MSDAEVLLKTGRFTVVRRQYATADGKTHVRESVQHPGAVMILPLLADGRVCLIRNFRWAVDQTLIELPAGTLEPNEDPRDTARRELEEETGFKAETIEPLCQFFMSPGILNERMHLFLATGLAAGPTRLEAGEQIEKCIVDWPEAVRMAEDGRIQDAKTLVGLFWYDRRLRSQGS
ncbi:MAG TPA: NUDIX hydrolase [Pirellulales bacterium]|nr:NUDIX hydrolase [Pirellulales bacterium]